MADAQASFSSQAVPFRYLEGIGAAALFLGTANPVLHLPLIICLYPAALYVLALTNDSVFRRGWVTGLVGASASLYWISVAVHDYGEFLWIMAVPCAVLLGAYVGLWGGLFAYIVASMRDLPRWRRCLAAALLWCVLEWTRSWLFTGFPWLTLSAGQAAWPALIQGVSVIGSYALSGVLAGLGCLLAEALRLPEPAPEKRVHTGFLMAFCAVIWVLAVFGLWRMETFKEQGPPVTLALIQGNMRQDLKWEPVFQQTTVSKYLALSADALANAEVSQTRPDVLVWPETAMPFYFQSGSELAGQVRDFARMSGMPLILGGPGFDRRENGKSDLFNRVFFVGTDGRNLGTYDKEHLVPFGEYVPSWLNISLFEPLWRGVGAFTPGKAAPLFRLRTSQGAEAALGMLICYEGIFPELAQQRVADGASLLVNVSNDAWYNRTSAPVQHLHLSLLRAVEQGRWLARSTNTGITAFVDPLGRVFPLGRLNDGSGLFVSGFITRQIEALNGHTIYFAVHPWVQPLAIAVLLLLSYPLLRCWFTRRNMAKKGI